MTMTNVERGLERGYEIVESCKTIEQLVVATNYVLLVVKKLPINDWRRLLGGVFLYNMIRQKELTLLKGGD